jgi:hypothetical protein
MPELHRPALDPAQGIRLPLADYHADFDERYARTRGRDCWKLERRQHFEEQNSPSREALRRGDLAGALRLLEERRPALRRSAGESQQRQTVFHRLRVIEWPLTPYLQWELHSLRIRTEEGVEVVRIADAAALTAYEGSAGPLPELVILNGDTLFQVVYTDAGVPDGAVRFTEPALVAAWETFIRTLYGRAEDVGPFVSRMTAPPPAHLPVPE